MEARAVLGLLMIAVLVVHGLSGYGTLKRGAIGMYAMTRNLRIMLAVWAVLVGSMSACCAAPTAVEDYYFTSNNETLTVPAPGVLGNDTGGTLTASLASEPFRGSVELNSDGSFTYTPQAGYVGGDTFSYDALDISGSSRATVTIACTLSGTCGMYSSVACGGHHTIALKEDGTVWAWGITEMASSATAR